MRKLMAADRLLAEGKDTAAVCRELGVSEAASDTLQHRNCAPQVNGIRASGDRRPAVTSSTSL